MPHVLAIASGGDANSFSKEISKVLPETNLDSLTRLVRAVIERVKPQPNCTSAK